MEAKLLRRQEREAAEERQKEKEKQRLASSTAVSSLINIDGSDDESIADEGRTSTKFARARACKEQNCEARNRCRQISEVIFAPVRSPKDFFARSM